MRNFHRLIYLVGAIALSGCDAEPDGFTPADQQDPATALALGDAIMVDPDLAGQNLGDAALTGGGPAAAPIPLLRRTPEVIVAARDEAARLAGNAIAPPPAPTSEIETSRAAMALTAPAIAALLSPACAAKSDYTMAWAARFPTKLPLYPRANVQEAAGTDAPGCALRSASFLTPVAAEDVAGFYYQMARKAGLMVEHRREGRDSVLQGGKGKATFILFIRQRDDGLTEADFATFGL